MIHQDTTVIHQETPGYISEVASARTGWEEVEKGLGRILVQVSGYKGLQGALT